MRDIVPDEADKLYECLLELANHHNEVSVYFKGTYPKKPIEQTIAAFAEDIRNKRSAITVIEDNGKAAGFCKINTEGSLGVIEYLIVLSQYRGKGYGAALMDNALKRFDSLGIKDIEVKVAHGNDALTLYEKYGFKMNAHILRLHR